MALIILSMTMFFVMLFATANAIRNETPDSRARSLNNRWTK